MADNPIDINKIFDFNDTTSLDRVIAQVQQLDAVLNTMVQDAQKNANQYVRAMNMIQDSVDSLEQSLEKADTTTKEGQATIANAASQAAKATTTNADYKAQLDSLNTTIKLLQDQIDKLSDSTVKATKNTTDQTGSLNALNKQLADAVAAWKKMGDATDAATKTAALKNVTDLNAQVKAQTQLLTDAKKATDAAAGSYNALQAQVTAATKQLKAFEGGIGNNSDAFKKLQQDVTNGNAKLKEFDAVLGNNQRNVGGYRKDIEAALGSIAPQAGAAAATVEGLGARLLTAFVNPMTAGVALIGAAFYAAGSFVKLFYEDTINGADAARTAFIEYEATIEVLKGKFKEIGSAINSALGFSDESSLINNLIKATLIQAGFRDLATEIITKELQIKEIVELENDLRKEQLVTEVALAENEDERQKALFVARDKENSNDETRFAAIQKGRQLQLENIALQTEENKKQQDILVLYLQKRGIQVTTETTIKDLLEDQTALAKANYDQIQKLADLKVKSAQIDESAFTGMRRIQALELGIIKDIETRQIASAKEITDAQQTLATTSYQRQIDLNSKIVENQRFTLEAQLDAQSNVVDAQAKLNYAAAAKEVEAARVAAAERVDISQSEHDRIAKIQDPNIRAAELVAARTKAVEADQNFIDLETAIFGKYYEKSETDLAASNLKKIQITLTYYDQLLKTQQEKNAILSDTALTTLNNSAAQGGIGPASFDRQKAQIEFAARAKAAADAVAIEQAKYDELQSIDGVGEQALIDQLKKLNDAKLAESDIYAKQRISREKELQTDLIQLAQQTLTSIQTIFDGETQARIQSLQTQLQAYSDEKDKEVTAANGNAEQIATANNKFAEEQAQITKKTNDLKHHQAVVDKEIAVAQIVINTLQAESKAFAEAGPLGAGIAVALAAIGAAQVAAVVATPIPSYWTGTSSALGGPANVAERGPEIAISPGGQVKVYDRPQIAMIEQGTRILNASTSEPILRKMTPELMNATSADLRDNGQRDLTVVVAKDPDLIKAVQANKPMDIIRQGTILLEVQEARDKSRRYIHSKVFGPK